MNDLYISLPHGLVQLHLKTGYEMCDSEIKLGVGETGYPELAKHISR